MWQRSGLVFCAGSSVVALATAFGVSAFAFGAAGHGDSAFGVVGLGDFAFGLLILEMVPMVLRPLLLELQLLEAESEAFDWMHSHGDIRQPDWWRMFELPREHFWDICGRTCCT